MSVLLIPYEMIEIYKIFDFLYVVFLYIKIHPKHSNRTLKQTKSRNISCIIHCICLDL